VPAVAGTRRSDRALLDSGSVVTGGSSNPTPGRGRRMPEQMALGSGDPSWIGEYQLVSRLGEGGQGVVYLAAAPSGARVVVKLLRMEGLSNPVARSRLAREVNAARTVARFCTAQV